MLQLGVEPDRLAGEGGVERGRLPLLLRPVLRVRLDVHPEQLERGHRQVLAHGDGAPAAHRVDADARRSLGQEIEHPGGRERQFRQMGVAFLELLLPDLELGQPRSPPHEVQAEVDLPAPLALG